MPSALQSPVMLMPMLVIEKKNERGAEVSPGETRTARCPVPRTLSAR